MNQHREYYHRHLPHWQPGEAVFFITFRLKGSLPLEIIKALKEEREREEAKLTKFAQDPQAKQNYLDEHHYFVKWDRLLDKAEFGPRWLSQPEIAEVMKEALHYRNAREYNLHAFCIMSNHVHVIFEPLEKQDASFAPLNKIMQSLKRHTARKANIILGREGAFW